ncbi:LapA family protein [Rhodothermus bifroesti]|uniref:LapA family protein n=1 Tax=Rhodothermus marinus TaxID=29549 RepID=A0A7V2AZ00_RHOMR|nr:LapA family protein [Rhodothermus bifroesti]GBD00822.1 Lipopolysaccharide assembly protein A [bacterium HR18]
MRASFLLLALLIALAALIFALQNPSYITVRLGPYQVEQTAALIIFVSFILGALVGMLAMIPGQLKRAREIRRLRQQLAETGHEPPTSFSAAPDRPLQ